MLNHVDIEGKDPFIKTIPLTTNMVTVVHREYFLNLFSPVIKRPFRDRSSKFITLKERRTFIEVFLRRYARSFNGC